METVTITEVVEDNGRGWTEVLTEQYPEPLAFKAGDKKVAPKLAKIEIPGQANVEVGVKANGSFVNRYLNDIVPANGEVLPAPAPTQAEKSARSKDEEKQRRIQSQWALGRAVELHVAAGGKLEDVLDTDTFGKLQAVATALDLAATEMASK